MVDEIVFTDSFKKFVKKKVDIVVDEGDVEYVVLYNNWLINEGYASYIGYMKTTPITDDKKNTKKGFCLKSMDKVILNSNDIRKYFDKESLVCAILFGKHIFGIMQDQCVYEYKRGIMSCRLYPLKVK